MPSFSKVIERDRLKPRRDPYWSKLSKGCFIGYRKMSVGAEGTWTARHLDEVSGKQSYKPLGDFAELAGHQRHDAACRAAQAWFDHLGKGGSPLVLTVASAITRYVDHLRETSGDRAANDAHERLARHVNSDINLLQTHLAALTPAHLEAWRRRLHRNPISSGANRGRLRSDSSLNREMTRLRAVLNLAYRDGHVASNFAWRTKLLPVKGADRRREIYLDVNQRRALVSRLDDDIADFVRGLCQLPLRPGALAALTAGAFDPRLGMLTIGHDKAGKDRKIPLPEDTANFIAERCSGKPPNAPLLGRENGKAWDKDAWKHPIKRAVYAAKLPGEVSCYTIRHSVITDLIHGGVDALTVAQLSGTSLLMIERHYGHLTNEHARLALARLRL